jgi:hypothetical protein
METLPETRTRARRLASWIASRPYAVFILAALALAVAGFVVTLPPEVG